MSFDGQNIRHFPIGLVYLLEIPAIKCSASKTLGIKGFHGFGVRICLGEKIHRVGRIK